MSDDSAFNGKLGVNMVLDSTPDTGPRVHAKENPRVSEMAKILRDHARHDYAECLPEESDFWAASDALEAKDKIIAELVEALGKSNVALNDWINQYAGEFCNEEDVRAAMERIGAVGTIAYIADVTASNRAAISRAKEQE